LPTDEMPLVVCPLLTPLMFVVLVPCGASLSGDAPTQKERPSTIDADGASPEL
jgi:hypothetical protein